MNLLILSGLTLSTEALAWTSPLLNQVPADYQYLLTDPEVVTTLCNYTERLFIGRMINVSTVQVPLVQGGGHHSSISSRVQLNVLSQVTTLGHQASSLIIHLPGGKWDGGTVITHGFPLPQPGRIVAIALAYPDDDYASEWPSYLRVVPLPDTAELPTSAEVTAAFNEVCGV